MWRKCPTVGLKTWLSLFDIGGQPLAPKAAYDLITKKISPCKRGNHAPFLFHLAMQGDRLLSSNAMARTALPSLWLASACLDAAVEVPTLRNLKISRLLGNVTIW